MSKSKCSLGARVLWTSSIESSPTAYNPEDWQLIKTEYSYAVAKYQIDLIATHLDSIAIEEAPRLAGVEVRHAIVHPGIAGTNIGSALVTWFTDAFKILTFYMVCPSCLACNSSSFTFLLSFVRPGC
jgi:3-keto steroid reductase